MRARLSFSRTRHWFAIDVGSSSIKIAEVVDGRGGAQVSRVGVLPVPQGAVENGFVHQVHVLAEAIEAFTGPTRRRPRQSVISIPGRGVIIKHLRLAGHRVEELDQVIEFEAMDAIPEDLGNVNLDYHVLGPSDDGNGLEILLIAARKALVENYIQLLEVSGLVPGIVDVDYFALRSGWDRLPDHRADALIHVGARSTTIHVPGEGPPGYTTELPLGGEQFTDTLAEKLRVPRDEAETVKCAGLSPEIAGVLDPMCERFASSVRRSLDLFGTLSDGAESRRISLSGGSAPLPGLAPSLAKALDAEVRVCGPFFEESRALPPMDVQAGPAFAVVAGLATRSPFE